MNLKKISFIILFISNFLFAQSILFKGEIGKFEEASAFSYTPGGFFFITDFLSNEIIKLDTLGTVVQSIGGYGWSSSTFDEPVDVFATDLRVYVTDKNNNRIQVFDKDLNYLFLIQTDNLNDNIYNFQYPTSCATSIQGDIYVLDSDNTRIMKFNSEGNFLLEFGNFDSAEFILSSPTKLALSHDSKIFVTDEKKLFIFDQYGMGLLKLNTKVRTDNINITYNNLIVNTTDSLFYLNLSKSNSSPINITPKDVEEDIIEGILYNNSLYILTKKHILHYAIISE